jgi:hypothetical protein
MVREGAELGYRSPLIRYLSISGSPWCRCGARLLDLLLFVQGPSLLLQELVPAVPLSPLRLLVFLWVPAEALLVSKFGTTPHSEEPAPFSSRVWGLVTWLTGPWSFWSIAHKGTTSWDRDYCSAVFKTAACAAPMYRNSGHRRHLALRFTTVLETILCRLRSVRLALCS